MPKFRFLINDNVHMHQIVTSGRAGTKSSYMAIDALWTIISKPNQAVVVMRKHHTKLAKTVYKECLRAIGRFGLSKNKFKIRKSPMQITYKKNGNTIYFTGSDSIDDTKGIIDDERPIVLVILDELTEFFDKGDGEDEILNITATFVRGNNGKFRMMYLFNPPKNPMAPVNQWTSKMEKRADCIHVHADYRDVPRLWLGEALISEAEQMKLADSKMYRWVWLGECIGLDELIYYMFDIEKHMQDYEPSEARTLRYVGVGVDYGQMNATTFQAFGVDFAKKKIVGLDEYYHSGRESGHQKSPSEYANDFANFVKDLENRLHVVVNYCVIDPSARGLSEEIKRILPRITIIPANNTVSKGISRLQKLLSFEAVTFCSNQENTVRELQMYSWDMDSVDRGKEVPLKENDHCMDAVRYICMYLYPHIVRLLPYLKEDN